MGLDPFTLMAGATLVGGLVGSSASKKAANTQADAANRATDAQTGMFDKTVGLEAPFRQSGIDAQAKLNSLLGIAQPAEATNSGFDEQAYLAANPDVAQYIAAHPPGSVGATTALEHYQKFGQQEGRSLGTPSTTTTGAGSPEFGSLLKPFGMDDFQLDPGIKFQTQQGNLALQNSQAAKDGAMSGAALKDLIGYNQGMAGTGFQSAFDRYMAGKSFTLGSLSDTAGRGQAAAGNTVNAAPNFSSGIAGTITGAGNAQAAGTVGSANALSGSLTGAGNAFFLRNLLSKNNPLSGGAGTNMSIEPAAIQPEFA